MHPNLKKRQSIITTIDGEIYEEDIKKAIAYMLTCPPIEIKPEDITLYWNDRNDTCVAKIKTILKEEKAI